MQITKMHGLGNTQIIVEDLKQDLRNKVGLEYSQIAEALCDPDFGIGSDQTLILLPSGTADYKMRVFNKNGSEAEMCGNGIRCIAKYLFDREKIEKNVTIETLAGKKDIEISENGKETKISVSMGRGEILEKNKKVKGFEGAFVSTGNPHFVIFSENASRELAKKEGPTLEKAEEFRPDRANIEFVKIPSPNVIETYVWERGAGLTLACGTGACAAAFAGWKKELVESEVNIRLLGGELKVKILDNDEIEMIGTAEYILEGGIKDLEKIYSNVKNVKK